MLNLNTNRFKSIKNKKKIIFLAVLSLILVPFLWILADTPGFELQTAWPNSPAGRELNEESTITDLVAYFYEWGIALGGLVAFIALLIAGFLYLTSVGDPTKTREAIDRIKSAFLGLILLLTSWLILYTINPELTTLKEINFDLTVIPEIDQLREELVEPPKACTKAILFYGPNFTGYERIIRSNGAKDTGRFVLPRLTYPRSFVMCRERKTFDICIKTRNGEIKEIIRPEAGCPEGWADASKIEEWGKGDLCQGHNLIEGGACTLQLFGGRIAGFFGCGDPHFEEISDTRVSDLTEIMTVSYRAIVCMRLVDQTEGRILTIVP